MTSMKSEADLLILSMSTHPSLVSIPTTNPRIPKSRNVRISSNMTSISNSEKTKSPTLGRIITSFKIYQQIVVFIKERVKLTIMGVSFTASLTNFKRPKLGVVPPPALRLVHNSNLSAPPSIALSRVHELRPRTKGGLT